MEIILKNVSQLKELHEKISQNIKYKQKYSEIYTN